MMTVQVGRVELAGFSSFVTYRTTQYHIPEDSKLLINTSDDLPVTEHWHAVLKIEKILSYNSMPHLNANHQKNKQNWHWKMTRYSACFHYTHTPVTVQTPDYFNDHELCITKLSFQIFMMTVLLLDGLQQF